MAIFLNTLIFADRIKAGEKQFDLLDDVKNLGADGIEIRYEYFKNFDIEAPLIKDKAMKLGLEVSLSIPDELFESDGTLNPKLSNYYQEALTAGSKRAKFNTGNFAAFSGDLKTVFTNIPDILQVDVENDQTDISGHIDNFLPFLATAKTQGTNIRYVYDMGNWAYTGGDAVESARRLAQYTEYIHFKNVKQENGELVTSEDLNDGQLNWQEIAEILPKNVDEAIEFPISTNAKIAEQIRILRSYNAK